MKKAVLYSVCLMASISLFAQQPTLTEFEQFKQELLNEYEHFREEANREYIGFLSKEWEEFKLFKANAFYKEPKPDTIQHTYSITTSAATCMEAVAVHPVIMKEPFVPNMRLDKSSTTDYHLVTIDYYGTPLNFRYVPLTVAPTSIRESDIASVWSKFSKHDYIIVLEDIIKYRKELQMNDWATYMMINKVSEQLFKNADTQLILQQYLLTQLGYDARMARVKELLVLLLPFNESVYEKPYMYIDNRCYYIITQYSISGISNIQTYKVPSKYRGEELSLQMRSPLLLAMEEYSFCIGFADLRINGTINKNKINFYQSYPSCEYTIHAKAVPDIVLETQLKKEFEKILSTQNTIDQLKLLLTWVQKGFEYKNDHAQFGYEKPFFMEEIFYYPYSDCEDRAILFAYLVRSLLNLNIVLLEYPNHLATAVEIEKPKGGDYITDKHKQYLICDPTYVGADIGVCIPKFKDIKPKVVKLN